MASFRFSFVGILCATGCIDSSVVQQNLESNSKEMQTCSPLIPSKRSGNLFIGLPLYSGTLEALDQSPITTSFCVQSVLHNYLLLEVMCYVCFLFLGSFHWHGREVIGIAYASWLS